MRMINFYSIRKGHMATNFVSLGRSVIINNVEYPLYLINKGNRYSVVIPENYPMTAFHQALLENEDEYIFGYVSVMFDILDTYGFNSRHPVTRRYVPWRRWDDTEFLRIGHMSSFYVIGVKEKYRNLLLPEERQAFRGLGKLMLCATLQLAASLGKFENVDNSWLYIEADGGEPNPARVAELDNTMSIPEQLYFLWSNYPNAVITYTDSELENEESFSTHISRVEENAKLIAYYKREYGFNLAQRSVSTGAIMIAKITDMFKHCS